jgi:hypothetical protein
MDQVVELQNSLSNGELDEMSLQRRVDELKIAERLEGNREQAEEIHIFSRSGLHAGIPEAAFSSLVGHLEIIPGKPVTDFTFPHDENPLENGLFVRLPEDHFYFLDPANAYRIIAKHFEKSLVARSGLANKYFRIRGRLTEDRVLQRLREVFPDAKAYRSYYLERGRREKDILLRHNGSILLVECKNTKVRPFKGRIGDLEKFTRDFEQSVQYGYEQALEVKKKILTREETTFLDEDGSPYFSVKRDEISEIFIVCVTFASLRAFVTDLSLLLRKEHEEPFPLAMSLYDFETICKYMDNADKFLGYLRAREGTHGRLFTGDEMNLAGYYYKFGNLDLPDNTVVQDDFSHVFDREWYREKGEEVEEPKDAPVLSRMKRIGNKLYYEILGEKPERQSFRIDPDVLEAMTGKPAPKMKGRDRNAPCSCGSGLKFKNCCGRT